MRVLTFIGNNTCIMELRQVPSNSLVFKRRFSMHIYSVIIVYILVSLSFILVMCFVYMPLIFYNVQDNDNSMTTTCEDKNHLTPC